MTKLQYINIDNIAIDIIFPADFINLVEPSLSKPALLTINNESLFNNVDFNAVLKYKYTDDLYNQVHIINKAYNFGYVSDNKSESLEIWNAYFNDNKTISNIISNNLDNVLLKDQFNNDYTLPKVINPLKSEFYNINVSKDGNTTVNGYLDFTVDGLSLVSNISLIRAILFDFDVNYINNIKEYYNFYTEILKSKNSTEQRIGYLTNARASYEYFYTLEKKEKRDFDKILYSGFNSYIALPIYSQTININSYNNNIIYADITNTMIQNNQNILIKDSNNKEILTVDYLINKDTIVLKSNIINNYNNPVIIPILNTRLEVENVATRITNNVSEYLIKFNKEIDDLDCLKTNNDFKFNKLNDLDILDIEPNRVDDITYNYYRNINILDNGTSRKEYIINNNISELSFNYGYIGKDSNEISRLKNLFNDNKGMLEDLYCPSYNNNFNIIENISISDTILIIENDNMTTYYKDNAIKYATIYYQGNEKTIEIIDIYEIDDNKEALVIKESIGVEIKVIEIDSCQFVYHGRLGSDELVLNYYHNSLADTKLTFVKTSDKE